MVPQKVLTVQVLESFSGIFAAEAFRIKKNKEF
jgi:hypothetical protein